MSGMPSPFKSPTATESVPAPEASGANGQAGLGERRGQPVAPAPACTDTDSKYVPGCSDWTIWPLSDWISSWPVGPESVSRGSSVPLGGGDFRLQLPVAQGAR